MKTPSTPSRGPTHDTRPSPVRRWIPAAAGILLAATTAATAQKPPEARPASSSVPATRAEAARRLDLTDFPVMDGADAVSPRRLAGLSYAVEAGIGPAYDFQKHALGERGWKEVPEPYRGEDSASGIFERDGFVASVSVFRADPEKPLLVRVMIQQLGNTELARLPVPPDARALYAGPSTAMFVTETGRDDAARLCRERLTADGWQPYGTAGDSLIFKRDAVRLNAMIATAPAQGGKTVINYSAELLSADLPAPPEPVRIQYADVTTELDFDANRSIDELAAFYRETLGKERWKATTEKPVADGPEHTLIFRDPAGDLLSLTMRPTEREGVTRGRLRYQTAAEVAAEDQRAREAVARRERAKPPGAKDRPTVALRFPAQAANITIDNGDATFALPAGKARAAVEALRTQLREAGWKEDAADLDDIAGTVSLSRPDGGGITIVYTDVGVLPAEINITGLGVVIEQARPAGKK